MDFVKIMLCMLAGAFVPSDEVYSADLHVDAVVIVVAASK